MILSQRGFRMGSMRERGLLLIALAVACVSATFMVGLLKPVSILKLSSTVQGCNVELYSDSACTQRLDCIDWGVCKPGSNVTRIVYIKNPDSKPMSLTTSTMSGASVDGVVIMWDKEGVTMNGGETVSAVFKLCIPEAISKLSDTSCDFTVAGEN